MKPIHINRAHNTQSCLLIIFQYQPIRFQYSCLSIEQPIRYWVLQKHPWKFVTHMMIIPILTCPINNGPINLSLWSYLLLVTFKTFLITLSAPATKSLQNLSVGGCKFCRSEYFICSCASHSFELQIYFYIYIPFRRSIIACEGKPKKTFSNPKHITTQIRGPLHIHPNSRITT